MNCRLAPPMRRISDGAAAFLVAGRGNTGDGVDGESVPKPGQTGA
jgi:hypothetical protein